MEPVLDAQSPAAVSVHCLSVGVLEVRFEILHIDTSLPVDGLGHIPSDSLARCKYILVLDHAVIRFSLPS